MKAKTAAQKRLIRKTLTTVRAWGIDGRLWRPPIKEVDEWLEAIYRKLSGQTVSR